MIFYSYSDNNGNWHEVEGDFGSGNETDMFVANEGKEEGLRIQMGWFSRGPLHQFLQVAHPDPSKALDFLRLMEGYAIWELKRCARIMGPSHELAMRCYCEDWGPHVAPEIQAEADKVEVNRGACYGTNTQLTFTHPDQAEIMKVYDHWDAVRHNIAELTRAAKKEERERAGLVGGLIEHVIMKG